VSQKNLVLIFYSEQYAFFWEKLPKRKAVSVCEGAPNEEKIIRDLSKLFP
jgi:hypothetical protein